MAAVPAQESSREASLCPKESLVEIDCDALFVGEQVKPEWSLFPNPTFGHITLNLPASAAPGRLEIHDLNANLLLSFAIQESIDLSNLAVGLYFLTVYDATGALLGTQKLIKLE